MNELRVSIAEMTSIDAVEDNLTAITELIHQAAAIKSTLLVLPENSLYFRLNKNQPMPSFDLVGSELERLSQVCRRLHINVILGSVPIKQSGQPSSAMVLLRSDAPPEVIYRKIHLFDVDVEGLPSVRESNDFAAGNQPAILEIFGWRFGLSICYDLRFAELFQSYISQEVDALLVPSAFLTTTGQAHWEVLLRARAIEGQCYVLAPAQGGTHLSNNGRDSRNTYGHSLIVNPWGTVVSEASQEKKILVCDLSKTEINKVRKQIPMKQHRQKRALHSMVPKFF